ncbi:MAG: sorbosone dehydrogenase family protein [Elusimicrobia bacterium]|nr:sorbosone dehydrogenase family protein [Elusimicrobiota bacterium]MBD3411912.1 sorbosone dehydrogenase family protein [Elusimicrobiota bacterium]
MKQILSALLLTPIIAAGPVGCLSGDMRLNEIALPDGFTIELYTGDVPGARSMARGDSGTIFVGTRDQGVVYAVQDFDGDYRSDEVDIIVSNLQSPNGIAVYNKDLYVAEISRVLRYDNIEQTMNTRLKAVIVNDSFPTDRHHGWKYIAFGPDELLYVPVGAPCNVCLKKDKRYASIMRMRKDGSGLEVFASGVRNTVGFDWHPDTKVLWFTDNGRDWMGDNRPPDELNQAPEPGLHFGFPFCHGRGIPDPEFGDQKTCDEFVPPVQELGPHVAALGMKFYTGTMFPKEYHQQIFIAEHGSWNRTVPIGYRIMLVRLENNRPVSYEVFAEGWLSGIVSWGRPVDLLIMPDGSMLVSDDKAGALYRISYQRD